MDLEAIAVAFVPPFIRITIIWLAVKMAIHAILKVLERTPNRFTPQLKYSAPKLIWILGAMIALGTAGINVTSFLTLFATVGIGAALIFTPFGQGLIAGFLYGVNGLITEGDVINVLGRPGKVTKKGALSVGVEYPDGSVVYLPNVKAIDTELVNHNRVDGARLAVEVKINGHPDRARAVEVMNSTLDQLEWRREDKPTMVHFTEIGSAAFHYTCYAWIDRRLDEPHFKSEMLTALVDDLEAAGISCGETNDLSMSNWPINWDKLSLDLLEADRSNRSTPKLDNP